MEAQQKTYGARASKRLYTTLHTSCLINSILIQGLPPFSKYEIVDIPKEARLVVMLGPNGAGQTRPEEMRRLLNTNPHPLGRFRVIGTLQNMPEFHAAFHC